MTILQFALAIVQGTWVILVIGGIGILLIVNDIIRRIRK